MVEDTELEEGHLHHGPPLPVVGVFQIQRDMETWRRMLVALTRSIVT